MDQSLSEIGKNNAIHVYILHSIAHGCHRLGKSQGKIKFSRSGKFRKFHFESEKTDTFERNQGKLKCQADFKSFIMS